jgi:hypothetical protein
VRRFIIHVFVILTASGGSSAAFLAEAEFLGFSPGGSLAAFGQYWIQDGSGFPGAEIRVMSVPGAEVIRVFEVSWTEEMMYGGSGWTGPGESTNPAWDMVLADARPCLDSLGISRDRMGRHCLCHLLTDRGTDPYHASFVTWMGSPIYTGPEYRISLLVTPSMPENPPEWLTMFDEPVSLGLLIEDDEGRPVMEYRDHGLEQGYDYVSDYRISDVYVYADSMTAVILNTTGPGFEGPDGMFRMITGVIGTDTGPGY